MSEQVSLSRRSALKLLAGQMALLTASCSAPREEIVPYVRMPERLVPGVPLRFATTLELGGYGRGVICTTIDGRPIKIEGNALHPASLGSTDVFAESAVLSLYDPDRSQTARHRGEISGWPAFIDALAPRLASLSRAQGAGLRILTGPTRSPTLLRQIADLRRRFPNSRWHAHDPLADAAADAGVIAAFGRPLDVRWRIADADVVVTLDADPLGPGPMQIIHARGFSQRRRVRDDASAIARLYAIQSSPTATGASADHCFLLSPHEIAAFAIALARRLGADEGDLALSPGSQAALDVIARDVAAHHGRALIIPGPTLQPDIHALCHWMNAEIAAPVDYFELPDGLGDRASLADLVADLDSKGVEGLFVIDSNPAYDAPPALGFARAASKAGFLAHLGSYFDETAALCEWHIPQSHILESWSDLRAPDGAPSLAQPMIAPFYDTRSAHELIAAIGGENASSAYRLVRETWSAKTAEGGFEDWWRGALRDGVIAGESAQKAATPAPGLPTPRSAAPPVLILVTRPDPSLYDGSFANNAWLQELPHPLTKEVWGTSIGVAPSDAKTLAVENGELLRLAANGAELTAPARIDAGHAPGVLSIALGNGRTAAGSIGTGVGANAYRLLTGAGMIVEGVVATAIKERRPTPSTQPLFALDGEVETLFPSYTLDQFPLANRDKTDSLPSLFPAVGGGGAQWGMVIDTTVCIGCNSCVVACQVENNSPVVGPEEITRGRDMHWLRIDFYPTGTPEHPRAGFQPAPCMHCETAPCEPVCPTGASVHDSEGLNVQVYNRCIGTRFCEANCPYKVRRFNYFGYADGQEFRDLGADVLRARNNPDVTVRSRGVMEKCTYCVQRISRARREADKEKRALGDGEVVTACQAACPTQAIHFGDVSSPKSDVSGLRLQSHHYNLLGHLNTRPRTSYLAQVRNLNPDFAGIAR